MTDIASALRAAGIEPRHSGHGTQRLACPECARAKLRPRDTALSLLISSSGAAWLCHRCGFRGRTRAGELPSFAPGPRPAEDELARARDGRAEAIALRARALWASASQAPPEHPYLLSKRVSPDGLRFLDRLQFSATGVMAGALLVPLRDLSGGVVNLQGINADGDKRFLAGGKMRGAFACVGAWRREVEPEHLAIGEGFATVATYVRLYPAFRGVAAMSAGNLPEVARILRQKYPRAEIVIAADQDPAGALAAGEASALARARVHIPGFRVSGITDWNDIEALHARA